MRSAATSERGNCNTSKEEITVDIILVASIEEKQRVYGGMLEELSEKVASVDAVDDLQGTEFVRLNKGSH